MKTVGILIKDNYKIIKEAEKLCSRGKNAKQESSREADLSDEERM